MSSNAGLLPVSSHYRSILLLVFASSLSLGAPFAAGQAAPESPAAPAQNQAAPPASDRAPDISTHVDEVSLDLVVHDKEQGLVLDLKPGDLTITDGGVPVTLTELHLVHGDSPNAPGHMVTLLFESFHGPIANNTRAIAEKILQVLPATGYSFSVLDLDGRMRVLQGFTEDPKAVEFAIKTATESQATVLTSTHSLAINIVHDEAAEAAKAKAVGLAEKDLIAVAQTGVDASGTHVDAKERLRAQSLLTALQDSQTNVQKLHGYLNFSALLALIKAQERIGDRRAIVYFTLNSQMDKPAKDILKTVVDAATGAGIGIYVVDMDAMGNAGQYQMTNALLNGQQPYNPAPVVTNSRGQTAIIPQQEGAAPISGTPSPTGPQWGPAQDIQMATDFMRGNNESRENPFNDTKNPLSGLSKATGGVYIDALTSTKKPLQQMAQDLSTYYQASYVPPFKEYDGKFRSIAVKPVRAGLSVHARTGYFAIEPGVDAGIRPFEMPLLKALGETQLPSNIRFYASVLRFGDLPNGNTSSIAIELPLSELKAQEEPGANVSSVHAAVVAEIKDKSGVVIEHYSEDLTQSKAREALDRDPLATISLERHFMSTPGNYTLEVAVLDQNSGKISAQRSSFEIPDSSTGLSLSDIVLVRNVEGSHLEEEDPIEPLRFEHQKVTPNVAGRLPDQPKGVSLFLILHPDANVNQPTTLEMQIIHNGKAGHKKELARFDGAHGAVPYLASLRSGALAPGNYEVKAFLTQGGKTSTQSQSFVVGGPAETPAQGPTAMDVARAEVAIDGEITPLHGAPQPAAQLPIRALAEPAAAPSQEEARSLIEAARGHALEYDSLLPNFTCVELTRRAVDTNGDGNWKAIDTLQEELRYSEKTETRTTTEVNGWPSKTTRNSLKGVFSAGEFGGILQAVFRAESKADFQWKETDALKNGTVQVYDYRVDKSNSLFAVMDSTGHQLTVGFHGQVFVDSATRRPRRVTLIADGLPSDFPTHSTSMTVDYDYIPINGLKYLMPVSAQLQITQGLHQEVMNTMEFSDYKRLAPM
jgi:VWFA-related protein